MAGLVPAIRDLCPRAPKTWMPGTRPGMTSVDAYEYSHRLVIAVDRHVDEKRRVAFKPVRDEIGGVVDGLRTLGGDPERARETDIIDRRIGQLHADKAVDLGGEPALRDEALLENAIGAVVEDDEHRGDALMCGGPQRLAGIHRTAVADERQHRAIRQSKLDAERRRQAPADAAAAQAVKALRIVAADERADAGARRDGLVDDNRVLRQHLADGVEKRQRLHRSLSRHVARFGLERVALGERRGLRRIEPLAPRDIALRTASVMSGSVVFGSPRIATCGG